MPSLYSPGLLLANERFDWNCQLSSLNIPSKGTHFNPKARAHVRDSWLLRTSTRSLRANDRQTLYSGQGDHERISDGSTPTRIHNCGNFVRISVALA